MAGTRRKARELAMQMLYQADVGKHSEADVRTTFWGSREAIEDEAKGFAEDLFRVANARQDEIDQRIEACSRNWRVERMGAVDRNVLRMAVAEMLGFPNTPVAIVIDEALEIARRYSGPESVNFLNGVLDAVAQKRNEERFGGAAS